MTPELVLYWRIYCYNMKWNKVKEFFFQCFWFFWKTERRAIGSHSSRHNKFLPSHNGQSGQRIYFKAVVSHCQIAWFCRWNGASKAFVASMWDDATLKTKISLQGSLLSAPKSNPALRKCAIELLHKIHSNESDFIRIILEIISDIQEPLEKGDENQKEKTEALQIENWIRCLSLTEELLQIIKKVRKVRLLFFLTRWLDFAKKKEKWSWHFRNWK